MSIENFSKNILDTQTQNKEKELGESKIREGIDFIFKQNPELREIGTKEQYAEYLATIFPDSEVKNIVYHGSEEKMIEEYSSAHSRGKESGNKLIYFSEDKNVANGYLDIDDENNTNNNGKLYCNLINIKSPMKIDFEGSSWRRRKREIQIVWYRNATVDFGLRFDSIEDGEKRLKDWLDKNNIENSERSYYAIERTLGDKVGKDIFEIEDDLINQPDKDGLIVSNISDVMSGDEIISTHYAVKDNSQTQILGSKQDIEKFKRFITTNYDK